MRLSSALVAAALLLTAHTHAADTSPGPSAHYDEALAKKVGADENGMRKYVLVILKTGPKKVPDGPERQEMFKGHFANIERLANEGVLAVAGPLDGVDGLARFIHSGSGQHRGSQEARCDGSCSHQGRDDCRIPQSLWERGLDARERSA